MAKVWWDTWELLNSRGSNDTRSWQVFERIVIARGRGETWLGYDVF
jgi:hypothetical protein